MNDLPPLDPLDDLASAALDDGLDGRDLDAEVAARVAAFAEVRRALRAEIPPPSEAVREAAIATALVAAALAAAGAPAGGVPSDDAGTRAPVVPISVASRRRANRLRAAAAAVAVAAGAGGVALAVGGGGAVLPAAVSAAGTGTTLATRATDEATDGARTFEQATAEATGGATLAAPADAARETAPVATGTSAAIAATTAAANPVDRLGDVTDLAALLAAVRERLAATAAPDDRPVTSPGAAAPTCPVDPSGETVLLASARLGGEPVLVAARRTDAGVVVEVFGDDCRLRSRTPLG